MSNTINLTIEQLEAKLAIIENCKNFKFEIANALDDSSITENQRYLKYRIHYETTPKNELVSAKAARIDYINSLIADLEAEEDAAEDEEEEEEEEKFEYEGTFFSDDQAQEIFEELGEFEEEAYEHYGMTVITAENGEYAIGTEEEANGAWEASLDSYLEDCVYPDLPESMVSYFDDEAWKRDARMDGRGHSLSSYDGNELDIGDLVAFRIN